MVSSDLGFTLLPEIAIENSMIKFNDQITAKPIEDAPSRTLALVTRKVRRCKVSLMFFCKSCRKLPQTYMNKKESSDSFYFTVLLEKPI